MSSIHSNLKKLSHSAQMLLETCPRLYELDRLSEKRDMIGENVHFDFGHSVGRMIQSFMISGDRSSTIFSEFLSYPRQLFQDDLEELEKEHKSKKDFWFAVHALDKFSTLRITELSRYKVAIFDGKPAVELGFCINCPGDFSYRGKLDAFLVTERGDFACLEIKTTGFRFLNEAMFRNSGQGIGYSAIVDAISSKLGLPKKESFPILYPIYQTHAMDWTLMEFRKSKVAHANWIRHLLRSIQHISEYAEDEFFPMHGQSCFHFQQACRFFEQCEMSNKYLVGPSPELKVDDAEKYPFVFTLDELIEAQLEKQEQEVGEVV